MATRKWAPGTDQDGGTAETSPWATQALTEGARAGTDETTVMDEKSEVAVAEEVVRPLMVDSGMTTLIPTDPAQEVHKSHASAVYEDAAPPLPPTKKATVASDSQRTRPTRAAVGTAAGVAAATTLAVAVNPAWIAGHTTGQTMIAAALRVVDVGRRTLSLTLRQWAITTTGQTPSTQHTDQTSHEEGIRYFLA